MKSNGQACMTLRLQRIWIRGCIMYSAATLQRQNQRILSTGRRFQRIIKIQKIILFTAGLPKTLPSRLPGQGMTTATALGALRSGRRTYTGLINIRGKTAAKAHICCITARLPPGAAPASALPLQRRSKGRMRMWIRLSIPA